MDISVWQGFRTPFTCWYCCCTFITLWKWANNMKIWFSISELVPFCNFCYGGPATGHTLYWYPYVPRECKKCYRGSYRTKIYIHIIPKSHNVFS
jgi:hypothetical protein